MVVNTILKNSMSICELKKIARTSQITPSTFIAKFEELLKKTNNIMLISFGSALSGTYNSACTAAGLVKENHPEANIIVIDSLCASCGQGLLVYLACKNRDEGMSMEENTKWIEDNKLHIAHWFTVDDLGALKRGGRLTATKAALATALGIKPVLHVDDLVDLYQWLILEVERNLLLLCFNNLRKLQSNQKTKLYL